MSSRKKKRQNASHDPFFDLDQAASATECTGLLPAQIETQDQGENVASLQSIHAIQPRFVDGNDEH